MYIDTDTGTIIHGPIVYLDDRFLASYDELPTDELLALADMEGEPVGRLTY
jgi:hypothetical protein